MQDIYKFPAILERGDKDNFGVYFPDLPGCVTVEDTAEDAIQSAKDALSLHIYGMEADGDEIPKPSNVFDLKPGKNETTIIVEVYMPAFREKIRGRSVKKTLTIPSWINAEAERNGVNFSAVLLKGLKQELNIKD